MCVWFELRGGKGGSKAVPTGCVYSCQVSGSGFLRIFCCAKLLGKDCKGLGVLMARCLSMHVTLLAMSEGPEGWLMHDLKRLTLCGRTSGFGPCGSMGFLGDADVGCWLKIGVA